MFSLTSDPKTNGYKSGNTLDFFRIRWGTKIEIHLAWEESSCLSTLAKHLP